jgi:hypothetical protein
MSRWEPHLDLMRLLEALANEIAAATDDEVHRACTGEGRCMAAIAREVRELIGAASGAPGAPGIYADVDPQDERIDLERSAHPANAAEPGRTCHRPH